MSRKKLNEINGLLGKISVRGMRPPFAGNTRVLWMKSHRENPGKPRPY
jgi:hypothetical protein